MLYVVFTSGNHPDITKFEKMPFEDAVALSQKLEKEFRSNKKKMFADFHLIQDDTNEELYAGTFEFGSYYAPNLYIHIKKKLPKIRTSKEKEKKRIALMSKMDEQLGEEYKKEEELEREEYNNLDKSRISRFTKIQRRIIYGSGLGVSILFLGISIFLFIQLASLDSQYQTVKAETEKGKATLEYYENALLGDSEPLFKYLSENKNDLTDNEKKVYATYLTQEKDYEQLVEVFDNEPKLVVTFLANQGNIEELEEFNEIYPTNEAKFELAYANKDYKEALEVENVSMNTERSKKKTYALLKIGDIEKAKEELSNNNDPELSEKIAKYEALTAEMSELEEKIDNAEKKERKKLRSEKKEIEEQLNEI